MLKVTNIYTFPKLIWVYKGPGAAETTLEKKKKIGRLLLLTPSVDTELWKSKLVGTSIKINQ